MEGLQVLDRTRTAKVKSVLTNTDVARGVALSLRNMREFVLDHRALPQRGSAGAGLDLLTESMLERLVLGDGHRAAVPQFSRGALTSQSASIADVGLELDHRAEGESLHLPSRARNRVVAKIQRKRRLRKQTAVVRLPRLTHDRAAPAQDLIDERAVDVPAVD